MELDALLQRLGPWFDRHRRTSWRPVVEPGDSPLPSSKFSGTPWVPKGEGWPSCRGCGQPIALFLQLDLDGLPEEFGRPLGSGLLQFFYCFNEQSDCEQQHDGWAPFSKAHLIRVVRPEGSSRLDLEPRFEAALPARIITDWEPFEDFPHAEEFESLGLSIRFDGPEADRYKSIAVDCPEAGLSLAGLPASYWDDPALSRCAPGDKLGGWPNWVQGAEYPDCPECSRPMLPLVQIDSEDNLNYMFGDAGCGHLTYCPDHPQVLAFGWACY